LGCQGIEVALPQDPIKPTGEMKEQEFRCRLCIPLDDEHGIFTRLRTALPALRWGEGDSSWDKIRVWGEAADVMVRVYRYESPGPFDLTIRIGTPGGVGAEREYHALRDKVLVALNASVWKPLVPQPVSLVRVDGSFPAHYEFESDLSLSEIDLLLTDSEFSLPPSTAIWQWNWLQSASPNPYIEGRIPFSFAGQVQWNLREGIRLIGNQPRYKLEVGHWSDVADRTPTCDQVHEAIQTTILPALKARNIRESGIDG
jgi:hypothetical protein